MTSDININIDDCGCTQISDKDSLISLTNEDMRELIRLWIITVELIH